MNSWLTKWRELGLKKNSETHPGVISSRRESETSVWADFSRLLGRGGMLMLLGVLNANFPLSWLFQVHVMSMWKAVTWCCPLLSNQVRMAGWKANCFPQLIGTTNSDLPSAVYEGVHAGPTPALNKFVLYQSVGLSFPCVSAEVAQKLKTNILMCRKLRSAYSLQTKWCILLRLEGSRGDLGLTDNFRDVVLTDIVRSRRETVPAVGCVRQLRFLFLKWTSCFK